MEKNGEDYSIKENKKAKEKSKEKKAYN